MNKNVKLSPLTAEANKYQTNNTVSTRDFRILRTAVGVQGQELQAQINVNAGNIELKVSEDSIISSINLSAEGIKISAAKLTLDGLVTFTNLSTAGQTSINGGNIQTNTITAAKIVAGTITADKLSITTLSALSANVGTLTAGTIGGWTVNSTTISRNGITLGADYISLGNSGTTGSTINLGSAKIYNYAGASVGFNSNVYAQGLLTCRGINSSGTIRSTDDGIHALGTSSYRFTEVWAVDGSINTSDKEDKEEIMGIQYGINFILKLKPVQFKWIGKKRNHYGFLAQDVKEALGEMDAGVYIRPFDKRRARV